MTDRLTAETAPSLRAILSERAPELLAALVAIAGEARRYNELGDYVGPFTMRLVEEIERAGLLAEPSQPAPLPAMFCGADAFTQEDSDAG